GFAAEAWTRLVGEMELTSLAIDVAHGGAGASFVEVALALEELGRTLLPVPFLPTVVAAAALSGAAEQQVNGPLLARIAAGARVTIGLAHDPSTAKAATAKGASTVTVSGEIEYLLDGPHADLAVIAATLDGDPALVAIDLSAPGVELVLQPTLDQT